jgi:hypothetical protein
MKNYFLIALFFLSPLFVISELAAQESAEDESAVQLAPATQIVPTKTPRQVFIENCSTANPLPDSNSQSPSPSCVCEADFLASNMQAEQFAIAAELVRFGDDMEAVSRFVTDKIADGTYTPQVFLNTANRLEELAERLGRACGSLPL